MKIVKISIKRLEIMKTVNLNAFLLNGIFALSFLIVFSCVSNDESSDDDGRNPNNTITFYYGADLSYVNEMEDCGAVYKDKNNVAKDVYQIFKEEGANIIRIRLWHNPTWTNYSNFEDVKTSIQRSKSKGMRVLLDFHYSDTWADPSNQQIPAA